MPLSSFCYTIRDCKIYEICKTNRIAESEEYAVEWLNSVWENIYKSFIEKDRWLLYVKGLGVTMEVAALAVVIGVVIGTAVAFMKLSVNRKGKPTILAHIANIYIDIIFIFHRIK